MIDKIKMDVEKVEQLHNDILAATNEQQGQGKSSVVCVISHD
jgi:hypothetical protein